MLLRRPDVVQAEYQLLAANAEIGAARAALVPEDFADRPARLCQHCPRQPVHRRRLWLERRAQRRLSDLPGRRRQGQCAVTEAQRDAALAKYQQAIQTAFREVADALARHGTMSERLGAPQAQQDAAADNYPLIDARYRGGIDTS